MKPTKIYHFGDVPENTNNCVQHSLTSLSESSKPLKGERFYSKISTKPSSSANVNICYSSLYTDGEKSQNHCNPNVASEDTENVHKTPIAMNRRCHSRTLSVVKLPSENMKLGGSSNCWNSSVKRSASFLSLDSSPEADYTTPKSSTGCAKFMNERTSDTALLRPDRWSKFDQRGKYPAYKLQRTHHENSFKQKSFNFSTPKSEHPNRSHGRSHHRSNSFRKSAADQTPFSPAESLSQGRIKRTRTSILPSYDSHAELMMLNPGIGIIDTHCHLDFLFTRANFNESYANYRIAHSSSYPVCYEGCIAVFCEPQNFSMKPEWDCILQEKGVWAAFGCHPHMAKNYDIHAERALKIALEDPKVIALGEIGLDYSSRNSCQKYLQHNVFRKQILIALEKKLPLVIHCREAHDDCMEIMQELVPRDYHIHLHCFTDKWTRAKEWLDAFSNLFIGITNLVTFPSAEDVHETAMKIPLERLLLETDSPYFVPRNLPQPIRWSHPGLVIHVAAQIASLKRTVTINELLRSVRKNTKKMYGI